MPETRIVTVDLGDGDKLGIVSEDIGGLVADQDVVAKLESVTGSIERLGRDVLAALKRVEPSKASVELHFGLAVEGGQLLALVAKGKGEASITAVLEWSGPKGTDGGAGGGKS